MKTQENWNRQLPPTDGHADRVTGVIPLDRLQPAWCASVPNTGGHSSL